MKKIILNTMTAAAVLAMATPAMANREGRVYTKAEVDAWTGDQKVQALNADARFAPGVYIGTIYLGGNGQIAGDSVYAGNTAGNQHSTVVTEEKLTRAAIDSTVNMIGARVAERNGANAGSSSYSLLNTNGANGGSVDKAFGVWSRFDFTRINDSTAGAKWDANMWTVALGGDYKFNNMFLAGLAMTYGRTTGKTNFNNGKIKGDNAFGLTPYLNVKANDMLDFDVLGGWARVTKKRERTPVGGSNVTATAKSNRYFFALAANAHKDISKVSLLGRLGYSYGKDAQKRFTESNNDTYTAQDTKMSRLFMRLQAGYKATEMVMPYLFVTYDHDFTITKHGLADAAAGDLTGYVKPKQNTSNWYGIGGGLQLTSGSAFSGGLEYGYKQAAKIKMHNANVRLRYQF